LSLESGNAHNFSRTLDSLALLDQTIGAEEHNTDLASFQVHAHPLDAGGEPLFSSAPEECLFKALNLLDKLLSLNIVHAMNTSDTVTIIDIRQYSNPSS
jgi:hypothetical protein